jgi:hypothetical protein
MAKPHYVVLFDGLIFRKNDAANHRMPSYERSVIGQFFHRAIDGFAVIASEAKQSRATSKELDCFVASLLAMTAECS